MKFFNIVKNIISNLGKNEIVKKSHYNYSNNRSGSKNFDGSKFNLGISGSGSSINLDHARLRQNSRKAFFDSLPYRSLIDRTTDIVVDAGMIPIPAPRVDILGISQEEGEQWGEKVKERFLMWASSKNSDRSGINNYFQNQHLYQELFQRDGDVFCRFFYSQNKNFVNPLQIQFIEPNQIRGNGYTDTYSQYKYDDGIVRNSSGRETAYKIWYYQNDGSIKHETVPAIGPRSGRRFMVHGYRPNFPSQRRGYPILSHILQEAQNWGDFSMATIVKAINQASIYMYSKSDSGGPSKNMLESRRPNPHNYYGSHPDAPPDAQNVTPESLEAINFTSIPEATMDAPGLYIAGIPEGQDLEPFGQTAPSDTFNSFVDSFTSYLASAGRMSLEMLIMRFNNNFSASRAILILAWRIANIWRQEQKSDFEDYVYESFLSEEIAAGHIFAPGWSDPMMRAAWAFYKIIGSPIPNIDPLKSVMADKERINIHSTTIDDVAQDYNGSDGRSNRARNARQFEEVPESPFIKKGGSKDV